MPVLKPVRGIRLNKSHPFARGLVGYWLLNEGSGNKVFDLSGNGNAGTFQGTAPSWSAGKFGSAVLLPGTDEYILVANKASLDNITGAITILCNIDKTAASATLIQKKQTDFLQYGIDLNLDKFRFFYRTQQGSGAFGHIFTSTSGLSDNAWHHLAASYVSGVAGSVRLFVNGIGVAGSWTAGDGTGNLFNTTSYLKMGVNETDVGGHNNFFNGQISHVMIYNRALSASEIALLYREPFCMFDKAWRPGLIGSQIVELAGTIAGTSGLLDAVLSSIRGLTGTSTALSSVKGSLGIMRESPPEMERSWLREALFNGMTANAFKLGTSLSLGWFWLRVTGCSVLYRGGPNSGMGEIDFANILAVSESRPFGIREISPPSYIPHNSGSTYFYVVRRFNNCGYQEHTLAAAVKVSIGSSGELAEPQPNNISSSKVEQVAGNKVRLTLFYCPLEQGSEPVSFNVYYDDRTGQIDYQNPLATIGYKGRKFYSFQSSALEAGKYLFAIRAEDAGGIENISLARLKIQLDTLNPDAIDILRAEAV